MTAAENPATVCPQCGGTILIPLPTAGMLLCNNCRLEYDPRNVDEIFVRVGDVAKEVGAGIEVVPEPIDTKYWSTVEVRWAGTGDPARAHALYTYVTDLPHSEREATDQAIRDTELPEGAELLNAFVLASNMPGDDDEEEPGPVPTADVSEYAQPGDELRDEADALTDLADMVGTDVILVSGQRATIIGFPDDDTMAVRFADGSTFDVSFDDVTGSAPPEPAPVEIPDAQQVEIGKTALLVAGLVLRAGLATIEGGDGAERIVPPPVGWLPADGDTLPVVEMGAAYAVATLIEAFSLPRETIEGFVDTFTDTAQTSEPTQGESDE